MFKAQPRCGLASHAPTMTVNEVDLNMDGIPDILQRTQICLVAPMV